MSKQSQAKLQAPLSHESLSLQKLSRKRTPKLFFESSGENELVRNKIVEKLHDRRFHTQKAETESAATSKDEIRSKRF